MVHLRIVGCLWVVAGVSLLIASLGRDLSILRDGEIDRYVIGHWVATMIIWAVGIGLFRDRNWAKVISGILILPAVLICLDMFLMLGVTRSGHEYLLACLPFILALVVLGYTVIVIIARHANAQELV